MHLEEIQRVKSKDLSDNSRVTEPHFFLECD